MDKLQISNVDESQTKKQVSDICFSVKHAGPMMYFKVIYFSYISPLPTVREKSYVLTAGTLRLEFAFLLTLVYLFLSAISLGAIGIFQSEAIKITPVFGKRLCEQTIISTSWNPYLLHKQGYRMYCDPFSARLSIQRDKCFLVLYRMNTTWVSSKIASTIALPSLLISQRTKAHRMERKRSPP